MTKYHVSNDGAVYIRRPLVNEYGTEFGWEYALVPAEFDLDQFVQEATNQGARNAARNIIRFEDEAEYRSELTYYLLNKTQNGWDWDWRTKSLKSLEVDDVVDWYMS